MFVCMWPELNEQPVQDREEQNEEVSYLSSDLNKILLHSFLSTTFDPSPVSP